MKKLSTKADPKEKLFLKNLQRFKKNKNATHSQHSMTGQLNNDNGLQAWQENARTYSGLA